MNRKQDEIIFGAKRGGVTWLYSFADRAELDSAREKAERLGLCLSQMLCGPYPKDPENSPRRFTHEDRKSHGLKIQMTECDELTRRALERQAVACGCSVEEFILDGALCSLASNEELTFVDPKTGEVVAGTGDFGNYIGCNVDQNASEPPPPHFTRIPIPPGRLLKLAPKTVISISAFCSRYWVGVIFFGLAEGMFASPTLDALVNAAASFSDAIGQQLVFIQNEPAPAEFSEKTIAYAKRKRPISRPYGRRCPN